MALLKLIGINIETDLYKGWTFDKFKKAYGLSANYKTMPEKEREKALEADWAEIEKNLPKKATKKKVEENTSEQGEV